MAAFQALGGFIATFADPLQTGLRLTDDKTIVYDESIAGNSHKRYSVAGFYVKLIKFDVLLIFKYSKLFQMHN